MEIVPFTPEDQEETVAFMRNIFHEMGWSEGSKDLNDLGKFFHIQDAGCLFLIKNKDKIMGTGGCIKLNNHDALMKRFYIAQELRGSGIARELLEKINSEAKSLYCSRIVIDVAKKNHRAIRFYEKNGFILYHQIPAAGWSETERPDIFNYYYLAI
jgi:ribosomal protein S18 acetylase RimI-like enzyme